MTKEFRRRKADEDILPWQEISRLVRQQPVYQPGADIEKHLLDQISTKTAFPMRHVHVYALLITIATLVVAWLVVKPGIVLEWKVNQGDLDTFRIYRSEDSAGNFELIHETSTEAGSNNYKYIDTNLFPWHSYTYLVEGSGDLETIAISQTLSGQAIKVLPTWILIIVISISIGYLSAWLFELLIYAPIRQGHAIG